MKNWLCEYLFIPHTDLRLPIERILGYPKRPNKGLILIEAENKNEAEIKFRLYYDLNHPDRKLVTYGISDTI